MRAWTGTLTEGMKEKRWMQKNHKVPNDTCILTSKAFELRVSLFLKQSRVIWK